MTHINPIFPGIGDPNWGGVLNGALSAIVNGVNAVDDRVTAGATPALSAGAEFRDRFSDHTAGPLTQASTGQGWIPYTKFTADQVVKAIDTANEAPNAQWFIDAYTAGFRLYIGIGTVFDQNVPYPDAEALFGQALAAGLQIGVYTRNPFWYQAAITGAGKYASQLQFFVFDVETDPGAQPITRAMIDDVKSQGIRPIIYSGSGMWSTVMGSNTSAFSDIPLWDTNTDASINYATWTANLNSPAPVAYGGWNTSGTMRIGVQQKFEQPLNGINVDLNSFDANFLAPPVLAGKHSFPPWTTGAATTSSAALLSNRIVRQGAQFTFEGGASQTNAADTGTVTIAGWNGDISALSTAAGSLQTPPTAVRLTITRSSWALSYVPTLNASPVVVTSGTFGTPLANDGGTRYTAEYLLDKSNSTVYVRLPNGQTITAKDSHFSTVSNGKYAGYQLSRPDATHSRASFTEVWADSVGRADLIAAAATQVRSPLPNGLSATRPALYSPKHQTYNVTGSSMRYWRSALARAKSGGAAARLALYGDSLAYGLQQPDPLQTNSYPGRLRTLMTNSNLFGSVREGYIWFNLNQTVSGGATICDNRIVINAGSGWGFSSGVGPGNGTVMLTGNTTGTADINPGYTWDTVDILYFQRAGGGSFGATIDAGTEVVQATSGANAALVKTISAGSAGTHTLHLRGAGSVSAQPWVAGVRFYTAATTGGVEVSRSGTPGTTAYEWGNDESPLRSVPMAYDVAKPDLVFLSCTMNDYLQNIDPLGSTTQYINQSVSRARGDHCDVVLVAEVPTGTTTGTYPWDQYRQVLYNAADLYDVAVLDLTDRWGSYTISNASPLSMYASTNDPSSKGYQDVAQAVFDVLTL
jgi:lysophospholipase L1-like esterase